MSIVVRYRPEGLTRGQYDEVTRRMNEAGTWPPPGLMLHVLFGTEGDMKVSEIWESEGEFSAFSEQIRPVLEDVGLKLAGDPEVFEVHELELPKATA